MRHPFEFISLKSQKNALLFFFILTAVTMVSLNIINNYITSETVPMGIVTFEFAGDMESAKKIVNSWDEKEKIYAGISLGLDYLYMISYST